MGRARDITGMKVGLLTVLSKSSADRKGRLHWLCQCACGKTTIVAASSLCRKRATQSCGCINLRLAKEKTERSFVGTPPYWVWRNFRARCSNSNHPKFKHYGGRGISVCARWDSSFEEFWKDMGPTYAPGLYLDRKDNNGCYTPENCRWVTPRVSTENRRNAILVNFQDETMILSEAARRSGIEYSALLLRFKRGVPESKMFTKGRITK